MDDAVALVQAYLPINGYLTVVEYPVVEAMHGGDFHAATDLDPWSRSSAPYPGGCTGHRR